MPRRIRRETLLPKGKPASTLDVQALSETLSGPAAGKVEGFQVRRVMNKEKDYRCPYCEGWVAAGTWHLVAIPEGQMEERRHYHNGCWAKHAGAGRPKRR